MKPRYGFYMWMLTFVLLTQAEPQEQAQAKTEVFEIEYSLPVDVSVTTGLITAWVLSEAIWKPALSPADCRWCTGNAVDDWGRGIRAPLSQQKFASSMSDWVDFAVLPALTLGTHGLIAHGSGSLNTLPIDFLLISEATASAMVLTQAVKFSVGRQRPFVAARPEAERLLTSHPEDNNLSFFSGHTSFAFSLVVSTGTVAALRGYKGQPWIWGLGIPLTTSVALLRMAADKHYLSDVLVGALVGSAVGWAVPALFHRRKTGASLDLRVYSTGNSLMVSGVF